MVLKTVNIAVTLIDRKGKGSVNIIGIVVLKETYLRSVKPQNVQFL